MKRAYIGLQRGGGILGWLIRLVTRSRYGHALIAFDDAAFSAASNGWGFLRVSEIRTPTRWYALEAAPLQVEAMERWCRARVGWKYDWVSVFKFTTLWRLFFSSREARRDRGKLFCSEGVYACALEGGALRLLGEVAAYEVHPGHFRFSSRLKHGGPPSYRGPVL